VAQEQEFQAGTFAMLAQYIGVAEQFSDAFNDRQNLIPSNESIETCTEIRLGREPSRNSQRESNLGPSSNVASDSGQPNVVNFRIRAPRVASCN
jgi:hypothetical protein